jgi:NodT family efflux transporter outer membrane factor (OMF) lipoprotein
MDRRTIVILLGLLQIGCAAGPDFVRPKAPETNKYLAGKLPNLQSQHLAIGQEIPKEWWKLFRSHKLNSLIKLGLENNADLNSARAVLRAAMEDARATKSSIYYPNIQLDAATSRQKAGLTTSQTTVYNLYKPSVNASYTLDIFGGGKRQIEAKQAIVDYQQYTLELAHLSLIANIINAAITEANLREQIKLTKDFIEINKNKLAIIEQQFILGGISNSDVLLQKAALAQISTTLPPLEKSLNQNRHTMAVLVGRTPSEQQLPQFKMGDLVLPSKLPISLPSKLILQRPDIQAAEALLRKASADIGIATAALFPQFNLTAGYGYQSTEIKDLFKASSVIWNYSIQASQLLFDGGALRAQKKSKIAAYDQAAEKYRQTVLLALQNVADSLKALEGDANVLKFQGDYEAFSQKSYQLLEQQYKLGAEEYLSVLTVEQQYKLARLDKIKAIAQRYTDTVALFQALGGGWNAKPTCDI